MSIKDIDIPSFQVKEVNDEIEAEKKRQMEAAQKKSSGAEGGSSVKNQWPEEELALLVKGVNLFPAGTVQRWVTGGDPERPRWFSARLQ